MPHELTKPRQQCITMLLAALKEIDHVPTKREAIRHIEERGWFETHAEDMEPYPTSAFDEPRWQTLIAWARKDALIAGFLIEHKFPDAWHLSPACAKELTRRLVTFQMRSARANDCYLWTTAFKAYVDPSYSFGDDAIRPPHFYADFDFTSA